ncbi:hypothetical protein ORF106L [Spotted knifejaw iridovirus]|nr:hypothetical protein ORF106L [Spotted knifejaw iridovirus]
MACISGVTPSSSGLLGSVTIFRYNGIMQSRCSWSTVPYTTAMLHRLCTYGGSHTHLIRSPSSAMCISVAPTARIMLTPAAVTRSMWAGPMHVRGSKTALSAPQRALTRNRAHRTPLMGGAVTTWYITCTVPAVTNIMPVVLHIQVPSEKMMCWSMPLECWRGVNAMVWFADIAAVVLNYGPRLLCYIQICVLIKNVSQRVV